MSDQPHAVHFTSARTRSGADEWTTPPALVQAIADRLGLWFALDVACESGNVIHGATGLCHDRGEDALRRDWSKWLHHPRWAAWCNPPYSDCAAWLAKCCDEGQRAPVVALVPARTDTRYWHAHVMGAERHADLILLLKGRVKFGDPTGKGRANSAPFPSAVLVWDPKRRTGRAHVEAWDWRAGT